MQFSVIPYVNVIAVHGRRFTPLEPRDPIALVEDEPWPIKACDVDHAAEQMFTIGNRQRDLEGRNWPDDVRSLSTGDLLKIVVPRCNDYPNGAQLFLACDRFGWTEIPEPTNPIVPLVGTEATSREAV